MVKDRAWHGNQVEPRGLFWKNLIKLVVCVGVLLLNCALWAASHRVPEDFVELQAALDAADPGDTVVVSAGTYSVVRPLRFNDSALKPVKDVVLRSESGPEATTIRLETASADPEEASVVIFDRGETAASVLDGFTITGGRQSDSGPDSSSRGGGLRILNGSTPTIRNCRIIGNTASSGGGIFCFGAGARVEDCTIAENSSEYGDGGGIVCWNATMAISRCLIARNAARVNCIGPNCIAATGGGVCVLFGSRLTVELSSIVENIAESEGGGIKTVGNEVSLEVNRTEIRRNFSPRGGGLDSCCSRVATMTDCVLAGNWAQHGGAVLGTATLVHCTIVGNAGGGIEGSELDHCIVWHNSGGSFSGPAIAVTAVYSCIETEEVPPGPGDTNLDPLFCGWQNAADVFVDSSAAPLGHGTIEAPYRNLGEALEYDLKLSEDSPCVAAGVDGSDLGASTGRCETPGVPSRTIHVAPGTYEIEGQNLAYRASLQGQGAGVTQLKGTVLGLRTGMNLSRLKVTMGLWLGGVHVDRGESPTITDCTLTGNLAANTLGGGIFCGPGSRARISGCAVLGNSAVNGGGIACASDSSPIIEGCRIVGNSSYNEGAAISLDTAASAVVSNCLIAGNYRIANSSADGTSIYCSRQARSTFTNCTIADNSSAGRFSSVVYFDRNASGRLLNCIIWNRNHPSIESYDAQSFPEVLYSSVLGDVIEGPGNRNADPQFVAIRISDFERTIPVMVGGFSYPLPDFTVVSGDYRLQVDSVLIDAGTLDGAPATDLNGSKRPCGDGVDVGAYEACTIEESRFQRGDANADSAKTITDPIIILGYLFLGGVRPTCLDSLDVNDDGAVDCSDAIHLLNVLFISRNLQITSPSGTCGPDPTPDAVSCAAYTGCD